MRCIEITLLVALVLLRFGACRVDAGEADGPRAGWDFRFKDFVIAGWCPPAPTDVEYRYYKEAGFNLVMGPRYPLPDEALDLAQKHGLMLVIDTYTPNDKPWGGKAGKYTPHPTHHPATLPELKWLHERYGKHPALAGYLLGDDYGALPAELIETTNWMRGNCPHLLPWICQNHFSPESLARHGNPISNPQIYPTLYNRNLPPEKQIEMFCGRLEQLRTNCRRFGLVPWPMFNVSSIDAARPEAHALVRFQVYSSLAYGAQGIWYFTYRGYGSLTGGKEGGRAFRTEEEMKAALDPKWFTAQEANRRVAAWGPMLLGRVCDVTFHTGEWAAGGEKPGADKLVTAMSDEVLVGILSKGNETPLAVVVNKQVRKGTEPPAPRQVEVSFAASVKSVVVMEGGSERSVKGHVVRLTLSGGGGQVLKLVGLGESRPAD